MLRLTRADESSGLYHALNRGNLRSDIFKKEDNFFPADGQPRSRSLRWQRVYVY
jgi:hypothetical protein